MKVINMNMVKKDKDQVTISKDEEVELSKEAYKDLDESLEDLKKGRVYVFENVDEFIDSLPD